MRVIDDEGFVLGLVNVIDLLVVLLVLAVVAAGVALVTASPEPSNPTQTVTVRTTEQPDYVMGAIDVGPVPTEDVVAVRSKSVTRTNESQHVAVLEVKLRVTMQGNAPVFQGERLYVGRTLRLDFGQTIVDATVIDMAPIEGGE